MSGFTAVADKDGDLIGDGWSTKGGNYWGAKDSRYPLVEGRAPKGEGEILIDARTAERTGYGVGDTVRMSVDGPILTPKVTGVFTTDDGNVAAGGTLTLFDTATAQKLFGKAGVYDEIDVRAKAGVTQAALKAQLDGALPKGLVDTTTGEKLADDQAEAIASSMSGMKQGLLVFAGIALFVGTFIIANTFTMLVAQRTKELALMRAVGASRRQVTRSVLIEAFVVGVVAAVTGLLAGIGIGAGMRALMDSMGEVVPDGPLVISSGTIVTAFAVGVLVTMLAAWLPGRRAAKIPPVAAMSSVHAKATTKSLVLRNTLGALFSAAGVAVVLAATTMSGSDGQAPMGLGAVLLIIGVFILTPLLSRPLIAAASPVLRLFGVSGKLARQNSVRNPRRTAATASALMIGLTLITGMTVMAGSLQKSIDKMASASIEADYVVSMANGNPLSPDVADRLAKADGVTALSPLRNAESRIGGETEYLTGVTGSTIGELTDLKVKQGAFEIGGTNVVVDDDTAKEHGWKTGSTFAALLRGRQEGAAEGRRGLRGQRDDPRHHGRPVHRHPAPVGTGRHAGHGEDVRRRLLGLEGQPDAGDGHQPGDQDPGQEGHLQRDREDVHADAEHALRPAGHGGDRGRPRCHQHPGHVGLRALPGDRDAAGDRPGPQGHQADGPPGVPGDLPVRRRARHRSRRVLRLGRRSADGHHDGDVRAGPALGPDGPVPAAGRRGGRPGGAVAGPPGGTAEHAPGHQGGVGGAPARRAPLPVGAGPFGLHVRGLSSRCGRAAAGRRCPSRASSRRGPG
ncbi:ABC-type lipoprotein release transport system permease subunit [Streptomyces ambofaciens]